MYQNQHTFSVYGNSFTMEKNNGANTKGRKRGTERKSVREEKGKLNANNIVQSTAKTIMEYCTVAIYYSV